MKALVNAVLYLSFYTIFLLMPTMPACTAPKKSKFSGADGEIKLITLDPGHFHAALVQKTMYPQIDSNVHVYAPAGDDLNLHLFRIESFNKRNQNPTHWNTKIYKGADFEEKMLVEKPGNVVVLAGNNKLKINYIKACVDAGFNVLTDKPMVINSVNFNELKQAFNTAREKGVLLYDIMTERYEITNMLQRDLSQIPELFGNLQNGSQENPAVIQESVHYFYKIVSGVPLVRPAWFFDINQEGEALVDVGTHLVDLIQWECFPQQIINYEREIDILKAKRWPTSITVAQFKRVTLAESMPEYLKEITRDTLMNVFANGEILYKIKGVHAKITVKWDFENNDNHGDTHFSVMRGSNASLIIKQGKEENYKPTLYIEPAKDNNSAFAKTIAQSTQKLQTKYKGVAIVRKGGIWEVVIPDMYKVGHEAHFAQVMEKYIRFLNEGALPEWEVPNMLAKYYTTTKGLEMARRK